MSEVSVSKPRTIVGTLVSTISSAVWTFRVRQGRKEGHGLHGQENLSSNLGSSLL